MKKSYGSYVCANFLRAVRVQKGEIPRYALWLVFTFLSLRTTSRASWREKKNVPRRAASGDSCGEGEEQTPGIFMGSWSLLYPISAERVKAGGNKAGLVMPYSRKNLRGTEMCLFQDKINKNKEYK